MMPRLCGIVLGLIAAGSLALIGEALLNIHPASGEFVLAFVAGCVYADIKGSF